jgi:hypothetical protein
MLRSIGIGAISLASSGGCVVTFLCRLGRHQPSRRSELDLVNLQFKSFCRRCGMIMIRVGNRWQVQPEKAAA